MHVVCPGCGAQRDLGAAVHVGALVSCEACAGVVFRLVHDHGTYRLQELPQASCPVCGMMLRLPDAVHAGASAAHCGQTFLVTYAYGAYALEHRHAEEEEGP
jgi:hypothetical protein